MDENCDFCGLPNQPDHVCVRELRCSICGALQQWESNHCWYCGGETFEVIEIPPEEDDNTDKEK